MTETIYDSCCPYCNLHVNSDPGNEITKLNEITGDLHVRCVCGEDYFVLTLTETG